MTAQTSIYGPDFAPVDFHIIDRPHKKRQLCPGGDMCRTGPDCKIDSFPCSRATMGKCACGDGCSYGRGSCISENSPIRPYKCDLVCRCGNNCLCDPNYYSFPGQKIMMKIMMK